MEGLPEIKVYLDHHVPFIGVPGHRVHYFSEPIFCRWSIRFLFNRPWIQTRLEGSAQSDEPSAAEAEPVRGGEGGIGIPFDEDAELDVTGVALVVEGRLLGRRDETRQQKKAESYQGQCNRFLHKAEQFVAIQI